MTVLPAIQPDAKRHLFHHSILRAYDIRGIVGETLFPQDAFVLGRLYGAIVQEREGKNTVCVGYDGRLSSPQLEDALVEGLQASGINVIRIGRGPTPMLYFATAHYEAGGGIMVTGSHNPPRHNGFKLMIGKKPFFGEDIYALQNAAQSLPPVKKGAVVREQVEAAYQERLLAVMKGVSFPKDFSVAWDMGNGAAGEVVQALVPHLPGRHILLNEEIDGTFPAHHPDPTVPENLEQLIEAVKTSGCDVGIAFDGDGDRLGVVDAKGRILWGDQLMVLFARDVLKSKPGATIIADVKASKVLFDAIAKAGGKPLMWKTGHAWIKSKMAEVGAPFAGEMSGHVFFADHFGFDDGIYAALRLLKIIGEGKGAFTSMVDALPTSVSTPELRIDVPEERKFAVIEEIKQRVAATGISYNDIDGIRANERDGWWLLRASNTQAALVARCEADTEVALKRICAKLEQSLAESGIKVAI